MLLTCFNVLNARSKSHICRTITAIRLRPQESFAKDTAPWKRGVLALPPVLPVFLAFMFVTLDRLAALATCLRPAGVTGAFSGEAYHRWVRCACRITIFIHLFE